MIDGKMAHEMIEKINAQTGARKWTLEWKDGPGGFTQWWIEGPPFSEQHEIIEVIEVIKR